MTFFAISYTSCPWNVVRRTASPRRTRARSHSGVKTGREVSAPASLYSRPSHRRAPGARAPETG